MDRLDCRAVAPDELYSTICRRYDAAAIGEQFEVFTDDLPAGVRIGMIEAGVRFTAERSDGEGWRMVVQRAPSPAMTEMPGIHHVVTTPSGTIWTSERAKRLARIDKHSAAVTGVTEIAVMASHIAVDGQESWVYVADALGDAMVIVDADKLTVAETISAPGAPNCR